jgi:ubiquinone biosynthesis accessory factor UbiJ
MPRSPRRSASCSRWRGPDLEEELSRFVGDLPARRIGRMVRGTLSWSRAPRARIRGERRRVPAGRKPRSGRKPELDEFLRGVDELREASDRVEARLKRLEACA